MAFKGRDLSTEELLSIISGRLARMEEFAKTNEEVQTLEVAPAIEAIKENVKSGDFGIWGVKSVTESINALTVFIGRVMLIQTGLLAFIAWRLF